ncbi:small ribosomal subunit protein uS10m-like isoform X2 [Porites lutea]|uniref:small ribosomal subunit protein uS10m-like isoform X2 n=1 Tax=Porites lutea TaxID=51062 RepID=UPI003CC6C3CC
MAAAVNSLVCSKCQLFKMSFAGKFLFRGFFMLHHNNSRLFSRILPLMCWQKSDVPYKLSPQVAAINNCKLATLAEIESKQFLKRYLTYFNLLIKLEGLDSAVLDNFCQFVVSASRMMDLKVTKKFNLATETFSQTLAHPPDTYKKHKETYQFKRHGRMIEIGEVPVEKSDIFVQYLRDNVPVGVTVQLELYPVENAFQRRQW